jgi:diacylglycerol kinase (ATP)
MGHNDARGFRHLGRAFGYSVAGFRSAVRHEAAFRQEVVLVLVLAPIGLWLGQTGVERALLLGSLLLVLIVELSNSAVEAVVDRVGEEYHPLSGRAKDLGSAAVFLAITLAVVVWLLVAVWPLLA